MRPSTFEGGFYLDKYSTVLTGKEVKAVLSSAALLHSATLLEASDTCLVSRWRRQENVCSLFSLL